MPKPIPIPLLNPFNTEAALLPAPAEVPAPTPDADAPVPAAPF